MLTVASPLCWRWQTGEKHAEVPTVSLLPLRDGTHHAFLPFMILFSKLSRACVAVALSKARMLI